MNMRKQGGARKRPKINQHVTRSGKVIKLKRSFKEKLLASRENRAQLRAAYLSSMPATRFRRILFRLHPKRVVRYWFSRAGLIMSLKITGVGIVVIIISGLSVFAYYRKDLPNIKDTSGSTIGGSNRYYDRTGGILLWEDYDAIKRIPVKSEEIAQTLKDATVAIEDRDFFNHPGFNPRGITRAAINNSFSNGGTQGGSTITQQLVKLTLNYSNERTLNRKIKELILAIELERSNTKQDILTGYLNAAPYGSVDVGIEAAAQSYLHKSAKDLSLDESAMLAAIPQSPKYLSSRSSSFDRERLVSRQHRILDVMAELKMIKPEERDAAKATDTVAKIKPRIDKYENIKAPYFALAAKQQLIDDYSQNTVRRGGWKITTTLDTNLQQIAEEETNKGIAQVRRQGGNKAAFVAEDVKTGQIVAMVGGQDFNDKNAAGEVNFATTPLPPGSSIKPYDYVTLIDVSDKFGAGSVLYDTQGPLPATGYECTNRALPERGGNCLFDFSRTYSGPVTLRYALGGSLNVPAVKATLIAGIDKIAANIEKLGAEHGYKCYNDGTAVGVKENEKPCGAAAGIGDGAYIRLDEHVHGYASLSRNGRNIGKLGTEGKIKPTYILKIEDVAGKTVDEWKPIPGEQAVRPDAAYIVADMMSDPNASYFSVKPQRYKNHKFSLKTGTTGQAKDGWLLGFTTQYAAGVWVGHHTGEKPMVGAMETMTLPIWQGWMRRVHDNLPVEEREKPAGVQTLPAFIFTKRIYGQISPSPASDLFPSWYNGNKKADFKKQTIDVVSNKLATDCTPARAKKEVTNTVANSFSGDPFVPGGAALTDEKDDVHRCEDARPTISLSITPKGAAGQYTFSATVGQGTHPIGSDQFAGTVNFKIDGQTVPGGAVQINSPGTVSIDYTSDNTTSKTVVAEVVDSVLYDASNSATFAFTAPIQVGFELKLNKAPTVANFTWNVYPGASTYEFCYSKNGSNNCLTTTSTSQNIGPISPPLTPGNYSVVVNARDAGNTVIKTSNTVSFKYPYE